MTSPDNLPGSPEAGVPESAVPAVPEAPIVRHGMFGAHDSGDTSGYGGLVVRRAPQLATPRPYGSYFDDIVDTLDLDDAIERVVVDRGELTLHVKRERLLEVLQKLRDDAALRFELSLGVTGVHYPHLAGEELHSVIHLCSITHNKRVRVEASAPDADPHIPSSVSIYPTHDWHEREAYDFFGIVYDGHPALTRIMMPDDWDGHPQRKDYPLGGIPVEYRGATIPAPDERRSYS